MDSKKKVLVAGMASVFALAGSGQVVSLAIAQSGTGTDAASTSATQADTSAIWTSVVQRDKVDGLFGYTQAEVSSNDFIVKNIADASKYLCGANATAATGDDATAAEDWVITVDGDVNSGYSATVSDLAEKAGSQQLVMGCSCGGNQADGLASVNALVEGIPATNLIALADPQDGVNTVVFTSSDGYEIALPLSYLESHYCPLVFNVNGSELDASVGGTNQLWLGSTPASYFARDVVAITLEARQDPPANPTSDEARAAYENLPNIGVLFGGEVQ